ncbi:MAG: murein biosynthesis integral membrane protein MurJ, partial [Chloroflexi bacterium]|nr:murein biosynthesis integral membrane protein MurJ [Chloroflexota bacterium]
MTDQPPAEVAADAVPARSGSAAGTGMALARAGLVVSVAYLAARILGYVRVVVIGSTFGAGPELDAFLMAFRIPDLIFQLVAAGTVAAALVPMLAGELGTGRPGRAWHIVSTIATLMLLGLAILAGSALVLAPVLVPIITPGFEGAQLERTIELTRLMLLAPVFLALGAVATSTLNAHHRFAAAAVAPIVYDLAIIGAAVILTPRLGVTGLAIGVVAGALGHLLVQLPALRQAGFRFRPSLDVGDRDVNQALRLMIPRAVALGAGQITIVVATSLATGLEPGSVTAFTFAFTLMSIPLSVVGVPMGVVTLPTLSRDLARGAVEPFIALLERSLRLIVFVVAPIVALGIVLREPAVTLLFNHGRFDQTGVTLVAATLLLLLLALPAEALITILVRAFYAGRDTRTPAAAALLAMTISITIAVLAVSALDWGLAGIGAGIAVGSSVEAVLLILILRRRFGG